MSLVAETAQSNSQKEYRRNLRVKENLAIKWLIQDNGVSGQARIKNISNTGMMISAPEVIAADNAVLAFEAGLQANSDFLPPQGRIVWTKKNGKGYNCGVEFVNPAPEVISHLNQKIQNKFAKIKQSEQALKFFGAFLIAGLVAIIGYLIYQQSLISGQYESSTHQLLQSSAQQAEVYQKISQELVTTKETLKETQGLLEEARNQIVMLQSDISAKDQQILGLQAINAKLTQDIDALKEKLRPFEAEVKNLDEGRTFSAAVRKRLKEIKSGIGEVKRQAQLAKIAALKESDRIALEQGNRGYLKLNGQATAKPQENRPDKKIKIDVSVFE